MPSNNRPKKPSRKRRQLQRDKAGDLYAEIPDETGTSNIRVSFRRNWYSPPFHEDGSVDYEVAARELEEQLTGGTLVVARYLENGKLGYSTEIPVASKDELEHLLRTMRKLYVEGLKHDNSVRKAGLEVCLAKVAERAETVQLHLERRNDIDRRLRERRGRQLLGRAWFRRNDRRIEPERRSGMERRTA
jgi:hypothetical protein